MLRLFVRCMVLAAVPHLCCHTASALGNTNFFDLKGDQHVGGMWKHVDLTDLRFAEPPPGVYPEPTVPGFPTLPDSYTVYYGFDQYLVQFKDKLQRGYGLFGRASVSDQQRD